MGFDDARLVLITGIQASGKTTVGRMLAARFRRAAYIEGDVLWQMIVTGRVDMADPPSDEARQQLTLRYRHGAMLAQSFVRAGFVAVHADNVYGPDVSDYLAAIEGPKSLVVLRPSPDAVAQRERTRGKDAYASWITDGRSLIDAISQFDDWLSRSPAVGLWVDSSRLTPEQTVDQIVERWDETSVADDQLGS